VTLRSYGPVRFGDGFEAACRKLGAGICTLPVAAGAEPTECRDWAPFGDGGPSFLVEQGRVMVVYLNAEGPRMRSGIGVGSSEDEVLAAYPGRIQVAPQKYLGEPSHTLTYVPAEPADSEFRIVFESDHGRIYQIHAGMRPAVEYVEGCL
jgi:hypothetical protein